MAGAAEAIRFEGVAKVYDNGVRAVERLDLEIREGEFFSLLGPSGCGKTTTLRMIAGFETPTEGRLWIRDRDVTSVPPEKRGTGMVFQSYALFPHRTVYENVAFGLRMRSTPREEIRRRVAEALRLVELGGLEERRPAQLSGGQQQRVALARAIVIEPAVLLCDEPLGALDKKLRQTMQFELKQLQQKIAVTLVYVTHDQEEALTMSDRIAVMNKGRIEQLGPPVEIYNRPRTRFVSEFIGDANLFEGRADGDRVMTADGLAIARPSGTPEGKVALALRPEKLRFAASAPTLVSGVVDSVAFQGNAILYRLALSGGRKLLAQSPNDGSRKLHEAGETVTVGWDRDDAVVLSDA